MFDPVPGDLEVPLVSGLLFALANGLHCAGMCGPFAACSAGTGAGALAWHSGRLVAYVAAGTALGALGAATTFAAGATTAAWISIGLAGLLVLSAFGIESRLVRLPGLGRFVTGAASRVRGLPTLLRAGTLGGLTALLPCGLLWAAFAASAATGSVPGGAATMLGFGAGSAIPLLLIQGNLGWLRTHLGPTGTLWTARILMLTTAGVMAWRGIAALGAPDGGAGCCHG
jgi:sulfite exporter TauE/SafE